MEAQDLKNRFKYHEVNPTKTQKMENLRKNFLALAELIDAMCPEGREKSLAITNLEQTQFWSNASIARNE